jgi:hypothetical protein
MELMPLDYHFDNVDFESEDLFISPGFMDSMACDNDIF